MTKQERYNKFIRQRDIIDGTELQKGSVTIIGAGSVGSFTTLTLSKMGVGKIKVFDQDGIQDHNLPAQFYRKKDIGEWKVNALKNLISEFADTTIISRNRFYKDQKLSGVVIVVTDNMESRRNVWEQYKKQNCTSGFIEARMGAELSKLYTIKSTSPEDCDFYEKTLHTDAQSLKLPCTARTIIYNVLTISGLICRAYKALIMKENFPRELIFNLTRIDAISLMIRE